MILTGGNIVGLVILDGWGYSREKAGNAIALAKKPNFDFLWNNYPHTLLQASGKEVGLPWGEVGNSEVGHLSIGAGRVVYQSFQVISREIFTGEFFHNKLLIDFLDKAKNNNKPLHLIGLISSGGVHSHIDHLEAIIKTLRQERFKPPVYIHFSTDGRDTSPKSATLYIDKLQKIIAKNRIEAKIATISGRYYTMDRDHRWARTEKAYQAIVNGKGVIANSPEEAIKIAYDKGLTDEFIKPTVIYESNGPLGTVKEGDSALFFNFRPERMRQFIETFIFKKPELPTIRPIKNLNIATMMEYEKNLPVTQIYPKQEITNSLAEIISKNNNKQIHLAETEKYAHITYFFDGWHSTPFKGEKWAVVPSPKVSTYDKKPEMSANLIVSRLISELRNQKCDFVLINFANTDMVAHTGDINATVKAVQAVDKELGRLVKIFKDDYLLITSDHGNAERIIEKNGQVNTEHDVSPVPFILSGPDFKSKQEDSNLKEVGLLADIAPTILELMKIKQPAEMTGYSLLDTLTK